MTDGRSSLPIALARELGLFWKRSVGQRDGARWTVVRRLRELTGVERLEAELIQVHASTSLAETNLNAAITDLAIQVSEIASVPSLLQVSEDESPLVDLPVEKLAETLNKIVDTQKTLEERLTFTSFISGVPLAREPLISIVMATLGERPRGLAQALASIAQQRYSNFEVLVIGPPSAVVPRPFDQDSRFIHVVADALGPSPQRNQGVARAKGEFITYADDDNTMGEQWLRAIVWALTTDSETDVVYGARLHETVRGSTMWPPAFWHFEREWKPEVLELFNPIDTQALAHRAGLEDAVWDEELQACVDWDLVIRLTRGGRVRPLPIEACFYSTSAPGRVTDKFNTAAVVSEVQSRARRLRRRRVLSISHSFPRITESYIESELTALSLRFDVAVASEWGPQNGIETQFQVYPSIAQAIDEFKPDAVLVHYADVASRVRPLLEQHSLPFGIRVHSYDHVDGLALSTEHDPLRLGLWAYPELVDAGLSAFRLPCLVHDVHRLPHPTGHRSGVVLLGAALKKRDWNAAVETFGRLPDVRRSVFFGTCHGAEEFQPTLCDLFRAVDPMINVRNDLRRSEVFAALSVSSTLFYLPALTHTLGNPCSIIEAWLSGVIPVLPDVPQMRTFAGSHARYFTDMGQAVELIREIEHSGDDHQKERDANRDQAVDRFGSPAVLSKFAEEFHQAFVTFSKL